MKTIFLFKNVPYSFVVLLMMLSCDDFVTVDPPRTDLVRSTVFENDETAEAAMIDVYYALKNTGFASGDARSLSLFCSLSSDELIQYSTSSIIAYQQFNENDLTADNSFVRSLWNGLFSVIYKANAIIEGVQISNGLTKGKKDQLEGEAKFIRAFCYFYLVNLWGDVPLITTTDYQINNTLNRTAVAEVYQQIVTDLVQAKGLLADDYLTSNNERTRPNSSVAASLLSRVYLYLEEWDKAEAEAGYVLSKTSIYNLEEDLTKVFRTTSKEAIFQLWSDQYPNEYVTFLVHPSIGPLFTAVSPQFVDLFETGDARRVAWIQSVLYGQNTYYWASKYKTFDIPPVDYSTVMRLAEVYLNRAESRVHLNKLEDALSDINIIRSRAGLPAANLTTQDDLLNLVLEERRSELFAEWGHRWFDLIRTHNVNAVLSVIKPKWTADDALYPIPEVQLTSNPKMAQNPNY